MTNPVAQFLSQKLFGMTPNEAWEKGICIKCKKPPTLTTDSGRREYNITALCEPCFDKLFAEEE